MKPSALWLLFLTCLAMRTEAATLFDPRPSHPWNRLYAAIQGEPPPPTVSGPVETFPRDAKYEELISVLDQFLESHAEKLLVAPTQRALLQNAVWATFDQAADPKAGEQARREQVASRCAEIVRRLAMNDADIAALPDNYAATVKGRTYPVDYDDSHRDAAFLPPDPFDTRGPWVMMGGEYPDRFPNPAAIQHVRAIQGRAVFYVFVRLPEGRHATLQYLRTLAEFPRPYVWNEMYAPYPYARSPVKLNPELPQFPRGTQVALLRRMVLPNSDGALRVTPLTESLQLRVYSVDPLKAKWGDPDNQDYYAFRLDADGLLHAKSGLSRVSLEDRPALLIFENPSPFISGVCSDCHAEVGVGSLLTYTHPFGPARKTLWFEPSKANQQETATLNWKRGDFSWGLLRGMAWSSRACCHN